MSEDTPHKPGPTERRTGDRRDAINRRRTPISASLLSAPFGAHILGLTEPSPISAQGVVRAYMKAANDQQTH